MTLMTRTTTMMMTWREAQGGWPGLAWVRNHAENSHQMTVRTSETSASILMLLRHPYYFFLKKDTVVVPVEHFTIWLQVMNAVKSVLLQQLLTSEWCSMSLHNDGTHFQHSAVTEGHTLEGWFCMGSHSQIEEEVPKHFPGSVRALTRSWL